jgi:hypothetical protein
VIPGESPEPIERSRIVRIESGTVVALRDRLEVRVVAIVTAIEPARGKIYFQRA